MSSPYRGSRLGTRFGPYDLQSLLGVGGMGEVYRAYDTVRDRMVAVKLLRAELAADPNFQERFRRESRLAARLQEPHVIPVHDFGDIDGVLYIDMRLVEGASLNDVLRAEGGLAPARAASIIAQVAAALDAAHADGLVHRDIKPENVLLTADDFAYLVDFGIAHGGGDTSVTMTGLVIGSCAYMAPERFDGGRVGPPADIYSLACLLYESLTGRAPFENGDVRQIMSAHMFAPPPRPSAMRPGLNPAFDDVIARGMAKRPSARYSSAGELAAAATAAAASAGTAAAASAGAPVTPAPGPSGPVHTRQFSAVYPNPVATGYTPYAQPVRPPEAPIRRSRFSPTPVVLGVVTVMLLGVAALLAAILVVGNSTSSPTRQPPAAAPATTTTAGEEPTSSTTEAPSTTTSTAPSTTSTTPSTTTSTTPSTTTATTARTDMAGADAQGFIGSSARCDAGSQPAALVRTAQSLAVVCESGSGTYYYRGERLRDGANIELANAVRSGGGFDVTNVVDGTRYEVRPDRLTIISNGHVDSSEPTLQYASG